MLLDVSDDRLGEGTAPLLASLPPLFALDGLLVAGFPLVSCPLKDGAVAPLHSPILSEASKEGGFLFVGIVLTMIGVFHPARAEHRRACYVLVLNTRLHAERFRHVIRQFVNIQAFELIVDVFGRVEEHLHFRLGLQIELFVEYALFAALLLQGLHKLFAYAELLGLC